MAPDTPPTLAHSPPRSAATILLVRDAPELEVLMLQRHPTSRVGPGALVFPGGTVDESDHDAAWAEDATGFDDDAAEQALRLCALRELYEESAILLARSRKDGGWRIGPQAAEQRRELLDGAASFRELVRRLGLVLDLASLAPFARWITPEHAPHRFDATFFIVTAPDDQLATCDGFETVSAQWAPPHLILAEHARGGCELMFPTRMNLQLLGQSRSAAEAVASARARRVQPVQPRLERRGSATLLVIPADAGYGLVEERVVGPPATPQSP